LNSKSAGSGSITIASLLRTIETKPSINGCEEEAEFVVGDSEILTLN